MLKRVAGLTAAAVLLAPSLGEARRAPVKRTVKVLDDYFSPAKLTVPRGSTITWKWPEDVGDTHDVRLIDAPKGVKKFKSQEAAAAYAFRRKLRRKGTYRFFCSLHAETMRMTIRVR